MSCPSWAYGYSLRRMSLCESLVFIATTSVAALEKVKGNIKKQADIVSRGKSKNTFILITEVDCGFL